PSVAGTYVRERRPVAVVTGVTKDRVPALERSRAPFGRAGTFRRDRRERARDRAMLVRTAIRILIHEKEKYAGAVAGVAMAVFLINLQWGFYLGFHRDITVVLDSIDADVWIVPKSQPLFDGWLAIDD